MFKALGVLLGFVLLAQSAAAEEGAHKLVGVWRILSFENEFQDGSPRRPVYGAHPTGYLIFTPQGRMMTVVEGEGRKAPKSDEDRASLHKTMFAFTGMYRIEGDKWVTKVDGAWNPAWNGTDQARFFKIDGDRLEVVSAWVTNPNLPGAPTTRGFVVFERVK